MKETRNAAAGRSRKERTIAAYLVTLLAICSGATGPAFAGGPRSCSRGDERFIGQSKSDFLTCLKSNNPARERACEGLHLDVFDNNKKKLPRAGRGQTYYESRVTGKPDENRLVFLVDGDRPKVAVQSRYYSKDHYDSFCELP
jgi:guanyl-specific ribonuclease Sa